MTRAFDFALKSFLGTCALFAVLAVRASYLCAMGAMPCRDPAATEQCPYDERAQSLGLRGTFQQRDVAA